MASCVGGFTRRLTTLHLAQVRIVTGFLKDLGKNCPVLEVLHMERCDTYVYAVNSPTLRTLAVIGPSSYGTLARPIKIMAPRLTSLRLEEFSYKGWRYCFHEEDGASDPEPLAPLTEASIGLTGLLRPEPTSLDGAEGSVRELYSVQPLGPHPQCHKPTSHRLHRRGMYYSNQFQTIV
jgi:hypothetical protein